MVSHCDLEQLPGMEFVACSDPATPEPHQDKGCQTDICASLESGHYKTEEHPVVAPALSLVALGQAPLFLLLASDHHPGLSSPVAIRPELPLRWAFTLRQALSPRAPSIVV